MQAHRIKLRTELFYRFLQFFPDSNGYLFGGSLAVFHEGHFDVQVFMIRRFDDPLPDNTAQIFQIDGVPGFWVNFPTYGNEKLVIMPVPVGIGTLSENLKILFVRPFGPEQTMGGIESLPPGKINCHLRK